MKKINMIVGKKQLLGVAVYLNWEFAKNDGQFDITAGTTSDKNYGDAALVNQTDDYFTQAHLDKQKTRDAAVETFAKQIKDDSLSAAELKAAKADSAALQEQISAETNIDSRVI